MHRAAAAKRVRLFSQRDCSFLYIVEFNGYKNAYTERASLLLHCNITHCNNLAILISIRDSVQRVQRQKIKQQTAPFSVSPPPSAVRQINVVDTNRSVIDERLLTNTNSPLHLACGNGHLEAVKVLVAASAEVNAGNTYGNAPIHSALIGGHRAVRPFTGFAENGLANPVLHSFAGTSIACFCVLKHTSGCSEQTSFARTLVAVDDTISPPHPVLAFLRPNPFAGYVSLGRIIFECRKWNKVVELLLEKGAEVKWTNNKGSSLLHFLGYSSMAATDKQALSLKLVEAGVDIDAKVTSTCALCGVANSREPSTGPPPLILNVILIVSKSRTIKKSVLREKQSMQMISIMLRPLPIVLHNSRLDERSTNAA